MPSMLPDFHIESKFHMQIFHFFAETISASEHHLSVPYQSKPFLILRQAITSQILNMYFCKEILNAKLSFLIFNEMFVSLQSISQ